MNSLLQIRLNRQTLARGFAGALAVGAVTSATGVSTFWLATRQQKFLALDANDDLLRSTFYQKFNPFSNEDLSDIYEARLPISQIRPDLVADFKQGGSKLIERYCSGLLGGWGKLSESSMHDDSHSPNILVRVRDTTAAFDPACETVRALQSRRTVHKSPDSRQQF